MKEFEGLNPWRVYLYEDEGDKFKLTFDCYAEDVDHAIEQAENAYPYAVVIHGAPISEDEYMEPRLARRHVQAKWKAFAVKQVLSGLRQQPLSQVYDQLVAADADMLQGLLERHEVCVWQPYENWSLEDVVDHIVDLAIEAQETALQ